MTPEEIKALKESLESYPSERLAPPKNKPKSETFNKFFDKKSMEYFYLATQDTFRKINSLIEELHKKELSSSHIKALKLAKKLSVGHNALIKDTVANKGKKTPVWFLQRALTELLEIKRDIEALNNIDLEKEG